MVEAPNIVSFTAIAVKGYVLIDAGGVAFAMSPEAAEASANDLKAASQRARKQAGSLNSDRN